MFSFIKAAATATRRYVKAHATGLAVSVGYVLTIVAANFAIGHWGTPAFPGGPHMIPVGLGYTAPSGVLFVSLALVSRDYVQFALGKLPMLLALATGAAVSYTVSDPHVALASGAAFAFSELVDFLLFSVVAPRWGRAVLAGGIAGAFADSLIFLYVAFGSLQFWQGQVIGKAYGVLLAAIVIGAIRSRRRRRSGMRVYLAGPINGCTDDEANGWRSAAKELLPSVIDPMARDYRGKEDESVSDIVEGDKADIDASDAVIAYCPKPSVGTSMEVLYCYESRKPCVVVAPDGAPVSPWLRYHATEVVATVEDAVRVLASISR